MYGKRQVIIFLTSLLCLLLCTSFVFANQVSTVDFWHILGDPVENPEPGPLPRGNLVMQIVDTFNAQYPHIKVQSINLPWAGHLDRYIQSVAAGVGPDVIMVYRSDMMGLVRRGMILPLNEFIARDGLDLYGIFPPGEVDTNKLGNTIYGMPAFPGGGNSLLIYNKRLFDEKGMNPADYLGSWQGVLAAVRRLTEFGPDGRMTVIGMDPIPTAEPNMVGRFFLKWLYTNNGRYYSEDGTQLLLGSPEALETLELLAEIYEIQGGLNNLRSSYTSNIRDTFGEGRVGMIAEELWLPWYLKEMMPVEHIGVVLLPHNTLNPDAKYLAPISNTWSYAILASAEDPEAAWEWVKYMSIGEGNRDLFWGQERPSAVIEYVVTYPGQDDIPWWNTGLEAMLNGIAYPMSPVDEEVITILGQHILRVFRGEMAPKAALDEATRLGQQILDRWLSQRDVPMINIIAVTASSTLRAEAGANLAVDGNASSDGSRWMSAADDPEPWLEVTLDKKERIGGAVIYSGWAGGSGFEVVSWALEYQNDEGQWVEVARVVDNTNMRSEVEFLVVAAQNWRFRFLKPSPQDNIVRLFEVELLPAQ